MLNNAFSSGNYSFFVLKILLIRDWKNDGLLCESKLAMSAKLCSDFFIIMMIFYSWNET